AGSGGDAGTREVRSTLPSCSIMQAGPNISSQENIPLLRPFIFRPNLKQIWGMAQGGCNEDGYPNNHTHTHPHPHTRPSETHSSTLPPPSRALFQRTHNNAQGSIFSPSTIS